MSIWMDMTHTLVNWHGKIVGIVRFELEIAQKMKRIYPEICFFVYKNNEVVEIQDSELEWLLNTSNVSDAYLKKMDREKVKATEAELSNKEELVRPPMLTEAYGYSTSRKERLKQAMRLFFKGFPRIFKKFLLFLFYVVFSPFLLLLYIHKKIKNYRAGIRKSTSLHNLQKNSYGNMKIKHPFITGDILFSCGWVDHEKFRAYNRIKDEVTGIKFTHFVYDLIPIKFNYLYDIDFFSSFKRHFEWISENCDFILYLGSTAQRDGIGYQKENGLNSPPSMFVKIGTERFQGNKFENPDIVLKNMGILENFIMAVGSIEPRKNYDVMYKAYVFLSEMLPAVRIPQFVIVGKIDYFPNSTDLVYTIKHDPRTCDKIIFVSPNDEELDLLYKRCQFYVLPTHYEGYSLSMSEALAYNKFCIVSDITPLREVSSDFVDYIDPADPVAWAKRIAFYVENPDELERKENTIKNNWQVISWEDCARQMLDCLTDFEKKSQSPQFPQVYYNFTTLWGKMLSGAEIDGILRAIILLGRELKRIFPSMKFYSLDTNGYNAIPIDIIDIILSNAPVDYSFTAAKEYLFNIISNGTLYQDNIIKPKEELRMELKILRRKEITMAYWFICSILPSKLQNGFIKIEKKINRYGYGQISSEQVIKKQVLPFEKNSIVFSPAFDQESYYKFLIEHKKTIGFHFCQIIYDLTPIVTPQFYTEETTDNFPKFLEYVYNISDVIFYGGKTAMSDGVRYQKEKGLPECPGIPVNFGNNISVKNSGKIIKKEQESELKSMGIIGPYILTVGTIQPRKNHETLYRAYIRILERGIEPPQLIIAGHMGWNTNDFINTLSRDERVAGKIICFSPADYQLDILYRNCLFTILASQYEGWSLTLPESLGYGKFCLTSDVPPLRETGGGLVEYIHPFDTVKWAERIMFYAENPEEISIWEQKIEERWHSTTWKECAEYIAEQMTNRFGNKNQ